MTSPVTSVGRYQLEREIGRGGMAEVFLAVRRGPGGVSKRLALKRIRRERASDPRMLDMFVEEARLSMTLAHRNIVPMFDFGRAGDELFLVMEYVEGCDLGAALAATGGPVPPLLAAFIGFEACQALDYAHRARDENGDERAIVHRDVTARNVLLSYEGEVKLTDFGVATNVTDLEGGARVRGTPAYMAPEQAAGQSVDARADLFSLGLVLYEMLAGARAYRAESKDALLELARAGLVPALDDAAPAALREIVARATARLPDDRYASARDMQLALDRFIVGARPSGSEPPSHQLADWLRALAPSDAGRAVAEGDAPDGPVVTFLDHGVDQLSVFPAGDGTLRSIAETAAESSSDPTPTPAPTSDAPAPPPRAPRWLLPAGAAVLAVAGALWWNARSVGVPAPIGAVIDAGPPDAAAVASATPDAGAADARVPDAAPSAPDARPRGVRPRPSPADAAPALPPGVLVVNVNPWAEVAVVGTAHRCAETPCTLTLPPGRYQLRLHNPQSNLGKVVTVDIESGTTTKKAWTLTRAAPP